MPWTAKDGDMLYAGDFPPIVPEMWKAGKLLVMTESLDGPHRGAMILVVTSREDFLQTVNDYSHRSPSEKEVAYSNVCRCIRKSVRSRQSPNQNHNLMNDISILMAMRVVDNVRVTPAGLSYVRLLADPDTSRPWYERGLMSND